MHTYKCKRKLQETAYLALCLQPLINSGFLLLASSDRLFDFLHGDVNESFMFHVRGNKKKKKKSTREVSITGAVSGSEKVEQSLVNRQCCASAPSMNNRS